MGNVSIGVVVERIDSLDDYGKQFMKAFGRGPDMQTIAGFTAMTSRW